jgi:ABC-2 type transport system ATP-binding protein
MFPPPPARTLAAMNSPFSRPPDRTGLAITTHELSKRYRRVSALTECTVTVPQGRICALIGPNGAGKTTLLRMLAGMVSPTGGTVSVLGAAPRQEPAFLADIGFLAQEIPLYRRFSSEDHIRIGQHMNPRWDASLVRTQLARLRVPADQRVGTLSGGQRAQVALALTLAKRPRLLLFDEPVAALDPLARRTFLATLTSAVAEAGGGLTVVLSSHLITDLERVCDHLILLAGSRVQLCGDIDTLLAQHKVLVGPRQNAAPIERAHEVVQTTAAAHLSTLLVRLNGPVTDPSYQAEDVTLEELVLAYMGADEAAAGRNLTTVGEDS